AVDPVTKELQRDLTCTRLQPREPGHAPLPFGCALERDDFPARGHTFDSHKTIYRCGIAAGAAGPGPDIDGVGAGSLDGHHRTLVERRLGLQVLNDDQPTLPAQPDPVVHLKPGGKLSESRDGQCSALADFPSSGQSQSFES